MPGMARYRISRGKRIEVALFPGGEPETAQFFLMTTPFAALIHQRGEFALHASAVLSPASGKALLIAGASGAGKSTAAAALVQRGWRAINDDVSRITLDGGEPVVWPGFQSLKLWQRSCDLLNLAGEALVRTRGEKEKYFWHSESAPQLNPGPQSTPIAAVLELDPSEDSPSGFERLRGRTVLETYFRHTFRHFLVAALGCQLPHFEHTTRLAASVPTYRLTGGHRLSMQALAVELESRFR
jgi:hypothetical protein